MRESEEKPSHHTSYPNGHKYKALFFSFSLRGFVTLSLSLLDQMHALFFSSTHTYIHTSDAYKPALWSRTKIFLLFFFFRTYIYTDDVEKIAGWAQKENKGCQYYVTTTCGRVCIRKRTFCFYY